VIPRAEGVRKESWRFAEGDKSNTLKLRYVGMTVKRKAAGIRAQNAQKGPQFYYGTNISRKGQISPIKALMKGRTGTRRYHEGNESE
jgi:hypothetical protein